MYCVSCKKKIPDDALFCQWCGKKQALADVAFHRRGNGLGSVYRSPSGSWCAEVTLGWYMDGGKKKRKKARKYGFKTKKEAVLYLERLNDRPDVVTSASFSELWERFAPDLAGLSTSKQTAYSIAWGKIKNDLGFRQISEVSSDELQAIAEKKAPTYYPRRDIKAVLSHLYQLALRDDLVEKNRASFIRLPKLEKTEREIFTADEVTLLWNDFEKSKDRVTAAMLVMIYTGMRPAELLGAVVENVHLDEHYMTGGAKTEKGKRRKIILPDRLLPVVSDMLAKAEHSKLCWYVGKNSFYDAWIEKRTALGLREALTPYCCRHTYVTNCTRLGLSPAMLQELVGHEDYETTLAYTHLSIADRLDAVNRL